MIQVTESAVQQIKVLQEKYKDEMKEQFIRLNMVIGWGGPDLQLALDESATKNDQLVEYENIKFLFDSRKEAYFNGIKLDYVKNVFGQGQFKIIKV